MNCFSPSFLLYDIPIHNEEYLDYSSNVWKGAFDPSYIQYLLYIAGAHAKHPMDVDIDTCVSTNMVQLSAHDNILLFVNCDRMCDYYVDPNGQL